VFSVGRFVALNAQRNAVVHIKTMLGKTGNRLDVVSI